VTEVEAPGLPERLEAVLKRNGMTRRELVRRTGISKNTLTEWGKPLPRAQVANLERAANALGVEVEELIGPLPSGGLGTGSRAASARSPDGGAGPTPDLLRALEDAQRRLAAARASFGPLDEADALLERARELAERLA
jgi:transcriptional regulator with XRE-family HTH domain